MTCMKEPPVCVMAKIVLLLYSDHYRQVPLYVIIIIDLAMPWWFVLSAIIVDDWLDKTTCTTLTTLLAHH